MCPRLVGWFRNYFLSFDGAVVVFVLEAMVVVHVSSIAACFHERSLESMVFFVEIVVIVVVVIVVVVIVVVVVVVMMMIWMI